MSKSLNHDKTYDGLSLNQREPKFIQSLMPFWGWLYRYYFRVETSGWQHLVPNRKTLIVGSHNGGLVAPDMFMCIYDWFRRFGTETPVYGLAHSNIWKIIPHLGRHAAKCGAIQAKPHMATAALRQNAPVLVYPGGLKDVFRPYSMRHQIYFAGHRGFIRLALQEEAPIVPMVSQGAHSTLIVLAEIYDQLKQLHEAGMPWLFGIDPEVFPIYLGLPWGVGIGPLPNIPFPVQIRTRVGAPITFERYGVEASQDTDYVRTCYEQVKAQMQQELDELVSQT